MLVSAAIAISYLDRQTLPVAIKAIEREIPVSNQQFSLLQTAFLVTYAVMYAAGGRLLDVLGTRLGFTVIMVFWSLACAGHGLAASFATLAACRLLLGAGEGGGFPAATAAWSRSGSRLRSARRRMGIMNAGTALGMMVAPPLHCRAFCPSRTGGGSSSSPVRPVLPGRSGGGGDYFPPEEHPRLSDDEREQICNPLAPPAPPGLKKPGWLDLLHFRQTSGGRPRSS